VLACECKVQAGIEPLPCTVLRVEVLFLLGLCIHKQALITGCKQGSSLLVSTPTILRSEQSYADHRRQNDLSIKIPKRAVYIIMYTATTHNVVCLQLKKMICNYILH